MMDTDIVLVNEDNGDICIIAKFGISVYNKYLEGVNMETLIEMAKENPLKCYGEVNLKSGRVIIRNYKRELKNGKGFSLVDFIERFYNKSNSILADIPFRECR